MFQWFWQIAERNTVSARLGFIQSLMFYEVTLFSQQRIHSIKTTASLFKVFFSKPDWDSVDASSFSCLIEQRVLTGSLILHRFLSGRTVSVRCKNQCLSRCDCSSAPETQQVPNPTMSEQISTLVGLKLSVIFKAHFCISHESASHILPLIRLITLRVFRLASLPLSMDSF